MDDFGLINMNGRVYDPDLGLFLSPDPVLQDPANALNYNRYSYVLNNPLKYTDPSGYVFEDEGAWLDENMFTGDIFMDNGVFESIGTGGSGRRYDYNDPRNWGVGMWGTKNGFKSIQESQDYHLAEALGMDAYYTILKGELERGYRVQYSGKDVNCFGTIVGYNKTRFHKLRNLGFKYVYEAIYNNFSMSNAMEYLAANSVGEKPDFKSLAPGERVAALLNYGKEYGIFNVHDCFDNVSANDFRIGDGTHMGLIYHNVYITIGKVTYNMDFQLGIKVTSKSYIDPIINMNIGSIDGRFDKNGNYIGTVFNKGYSMPLMITIWGTKSQGESFWKWYNGH
jgi:RHS repeat-associated protein